jgi:hypothetical protein
VPDSKTPEGRRLVPMSTRVFEILRARCDARREGWIFPSAASGHLRSICNLFRQARNEAGLPKELVLYCARHHYGTRVLMRTGNLAAVKPFSLRRCLRAWRMVIERGGHDLQFRVLIIHRSLCVAMPHRSHGAANSKGTRRSLARYRMPRDWAFSTRDNHRGYLRK